MDIVSYILNKNSIGEIQDEVDQIEEDLVDINTELDKKVNKDELGSSAYLDAPAIGDAADNEVVLGCDSRLTDARTPVAHTHLMNEIADLPTLGTVVTYDIPVMGDALPNEVVMGDDTRLTDNRDPNPHNHVVADITDFPTLGTAAAKDYTSTYDPTSSDLVTGEVVGEAINSLPNPMVFKGSLGDGGTITQLPAPVAANEGFTYKVITEGTYAGVQAGIGDMFTCGDPDNDHIFEWVHFPSGDEPGGTVMSVKIQGSGAIAVDDESAITTSGVRTISHNDSGVSAGTYTSVTVDGKGHVTAGSNPAISYNDLTDKPTLGTAAAFDVPVSGNAGSGQVVKGDDSRLTDARTPVSHTHTLSEITDAGTAAALDVPTTGDASSTEVVLGSDTRLTDARTPVSHTHTISEITDFPTLGTASALDVATTGDASSSQVVKGDDSRLADARTPVSHTHTLSEVTDAGTAAALNVATSGDASISEVVKGDDSRLTDSRNAADVYSWAKASTKPSYTASEVGALADTTKYAGASTAGGAATSAEKLTNTSKIGDTNKPVYFTANGVPEAISYTIEKSVPSNAVFTDTNTTYSMTRDGESVKLTPSSGTAQSISLSSLINGLGEGTSPATANDYIVCQYAGGGTTTTTYYRRKASNVINGTIVKAALGTGSSTTTYLRNDGSWATPTDTNTTYTVATGDANGQIKVTPSSGSAYNVSVKGLGSNAYTSTSYLPLAGGTMTGNLTFSGSTGIQYTGTKATYGMIKFKDNTSDTYGNGIIIGGGGLTIIGAGEAADTVAAQYSTGGSEDMVVAGDGNVYIYSNVNNGYSSRKTFTFGTNGTLTATAFSGPLTGNVTGNCSGSSGSCTGNAATATTASKLGSSTVGSATKPIYLNAGTATACTYALNKDVPSDAVFTDHTYNFSGTSFTSNNSSGVNANDVTYNAHTYYTSNGPATSLGASTNDGALFTQAYSTSWVGQIAQDYRNGGLYVRGKNNGTWQSWYKVWDSRNLTNLNQLTNGPGYITGITKAMVTNALGYTPPTSDTNDKVTQTASTTDAKYEVLFSATADNTTRTEGAGKAATLRFNPSKGALMEGNNTVATGNYSHAEGTGTTASGNYSHAEGSNTSATGTNSHAEGSGCKALDASAHAEGVSTCAKGSYSHAEGYQSKANGSYSHVEGYITYANTDSGHAEGRQTSAYASYSHTEGCGSYTGNANMYACHAEGYYCSATGDYGAHAEGNHTCASASCQHVCGQYNSATNSRIFIIGGGTSSTRSNAMSVTTAGAAYAASWNPGGADYAEYFEWYDQNINNEDRVGYFVTLDENDYTKIRIANNNDNYILGVISSTPGVLGNNDYTDIWKKAYLKDKFGRIIYEEIPEYKENLDTGEKYPVLDKNGNQVYQKQPVLNPEYDQSIEYVHREDRPEWDPVGMLGVLKVYDDGTCIPGQFCTVNENGIATLITEYNKFDNYYRVTKRVDENIIEIIFK